MSEKKAPQNAQQYRKPPARRTQVSFFDNDEREFATQQEPFVQREKEIRRDLDQVKKDLSVTLYDIDSAIKLFIENTIDPLVEENGNVIHVPIVYLGAEKWKSIQRDGFLRDAKGMVMSPLIAFRRTSVVVDDALRKNRVASLEQSSYLTKTKYSNLNKYDKFSALEGSSNPGEYYRIMIPEYVLIDYEFTIWTTQHSQLNSLIETFLYWQGKAFGDPNWFKFTSKIDSYNIEVVNNTGEDRLVTATFTMNTRGHIIPNYTGKERAVERVVGVSKVKFGEETSLHSNGLGNYKSPYVYPQENGEGSKI